MALPTRITLPPSGRSLGGLLDAARPTGATDWWRGVTFSSGQCLVPQVVGSCTDGETTKTTQNLSTVASFDVFSVLQALECSTMGSSQLEGFASQSLDVTREYGVGSELLTGAASSNPSLSDADVVTSDATDVVGALGCIEDEISKGLYGRLGFVHVPPQVATVLMAESAIYKEGRVWYTATGNIVVASPAYDGREPGQDAPSPGDPLFIYATGVVYAEVGQREVLSATERGQNSLQAIAEDAAIAVFDPCFNIAIDSGLVACGVVS